jgi:glycosyltransferase involved in cell wall biosynthesis
MKILCVIDSFGSGGAQRQMVTLACGLKQRGHDVEFFIYHPAHTHFADRVVASGIPIHEVWKGKGFSLKVVRRLSSLVRSGAYDIVLSYMASPNVYAELSCLASRSTRLVVSERGSHFGDASRNGAILRRSLHRLADHIVVNSASHAAWLAEHHPWMKDKLSVIYNGFDMSAFNPAPLPLRKPSDLRLIAVGRVHPGKNLLRLIEALQILSRSAGWVPEVSWVGRREELSAADRDYSSQVDALLDQSPEVKRAWHWLGERQDIPQLLTQHHALIHPTLHEGLPNVVCESLASGRPVLVSNVCDNPRLAGEPDRGFVFDPNSAAGIAAAIERLAGLDELTWSRMSSAARVYAEKNLSVERLIDDYEELFGTLTKRQPRRTAA